MKLEELKVQEVKLAKLLVKLRNKNNNTEYNFNESNKKASGKYEN